MATDSVLAMSDLATVALCGAGATEIDAGALDSEWSNSSTSVRDLRWYNGKH